MTGIDGRVVSADFDRAGAPPVGADDPDDTPAGGRSGGERTGPQQRAPGEVRAPHSLGPGGDVGDTQDEDDHGRAYMELHRGEPGELAQPQRVGEARYQAGDQRTGERQGQQR